MRAASLSIGMLVCILLAGCAADAPSTARAPHAAASQAVPSPSLPGPHPVARGSPAASATPAARTAAPPPLPSATLPSRSSTPPATPLAVTLTPGSASTPMPPQVLPTRRPGSWEWDATPAPSPTPFSPPPLAGTLYLVRQDTLVAADLSAGTEQAIARGEHFELAPGGTSLLVVHGQTLELLSMSGELRGRLSDVGPYGATWAPNGQSVAAVRCRQADCDAKPEIWILERESGRSFKLANGFAPSWAPDSSAILFSRCPDAARDCPSGRQLWLVEPDGGEPHQLAEGWSAIWSPDSQRIAYIGPSPQEPGAEALFLINRHGERAWSPLQSGLAPAGLSMSRLALNAIFWSPDGRSIYVQTLLQREWALSTVFLLERVDSFSGAAELVAVLLDTVAKGISPDGRYLLAHGSGPAVIPMLDVYQLFDAPVPCAAAWCQLNGLELMVFARLSSVHWWVYSYSWSPDGRLLALHICAPGPENAMSDPNARCPAGQPPEIRLLDPATGGRSTPLLQAVHQLIGWRR